MTASQLIRTAAVALLGLTSFVAFAGDEKVYAGNACQMTYRCDGSANCLEQKLTSSYGRIYNASTTRDLYVECPIIKDDYGGSDFNRAGLYFIDANPTNGFYCTFYSMSSVSSHSAYGWFSSRSSSSSFVSGSGSNYLGFSQLPANRYHGYAGISCRVPRLHNYRRSYLISYTVDE